MRPHYPLLCTIFLNASCAAPNSEDISLLGWGEWSALMRHGGIEVPTSKKCKKPDLDMIYITTNFDDPTLKIESWTDGGLMRFEFIEVGRGRSAGMPLSVSGSVPAPLSLCPRLCRLWLRPCLCPCPCPCPCPCLG